MNPVLVNLTGFQFGNPSDESGTNLDTFTRRFFSKKIRVPDKQGSARGKVYYDFQIEGTLSGEVAGSNGVMATTIGAVLTLANTVFGFGINTGGVYTDEVTLTNNREKLQDVSVKWSVDPAIS